MFRRVSANFRVFRRVSPHFAVFRRILSFRLVSNSVTLNDLERRNSPNGCAISPNSVDFWADYVKVVEDTSVLSAAEM